MKMRDILFDYKCVIWDWNGTIIDDTWLCVEIIRRILRKYDLPDIDMKTYRDIFDFPVVDYYKRLGFDTSSESMAILAEDFMNEYYLRVYECKLFEDCTSLIKELNSSEIENVILSASNVHSLKKVIHDFGISSLFGSINGLENHYAESKVEVGRKWFNDKGMSPSECIMIGDTCHDSEVANELGISSIIIARGHQSPEKICTCVESENFVKLKNDIFFNKNI